MIRLGLVGVNWGSKYISTIAGMNDIQLTAVCRQSKNKLDLPEGCELFRDWEEFADQASGLCDGVIIVTPPHLHVPMALDLFKQRVPVLIEKPVCLFKGDLKILNRESKKHATPYLVGYTHLYSEAYQALKSLVKPPVSAIQSWGMNAGPYRVGYSSLFDYGPHDLSMCLDLMQYTPDVNNVRAVRTEEGEIYDLTLRFRHSPIGKDGGVVAIVRVGNGSRKKQRRFQVFCESGTLEYDDIKSDKLTLNGERIEIPTTSPLENVVRAFTRTIKGQAGPPTEPWLSATITTVLEDAYDSILG